jgi:hypothetical protein
LVASNHAPRQQTLDLLARPERVALEASIKIRARPADISSALS